MILMKLLDTNHDKPKHIKSLPNEGTNRISNHKKYPHLNYPTYISTLTHRSKKSLNDCLDRCVCLRLLGKCIKTSCHKIDRFKLCANHLNHFTYTSTLIHRSKMSLKDCLDACVCFILLEKCIRTSCQKLDKSLVKIVCFELLAKQNITSFTTGLVSHACLKLLEKRNNVGLARYVCFKYLVKQNKTPSNVGLDKYKQLATRIINDDSKYNRNSVYAKHFPPPNQYPRWPTT